jgi:ribonuclease D
VAIGHLCFTCIYSLASWRELAAMRQFELRVRVVSEHILLDFQIPNSSFQIQAAAGGG